MFDQQAKGLIYKLGCEFAPGAVNFAVFYP